MRSNLSVVLMSTSRQKGHELAEALANHGLLVSVCEEPAEVYRCIRHVVACKGNESPPLLVLTDMEQRSRTVVSSLRALAPETGIMLILGNADEPELAAHFQMGIDIWAPETASAELLVAMLLELARRQVEWQARGEQYVSSAMPSPVPGRWALDEQGWVLTSPDGIGISLTTAERAFLMLLLSTPNKKVPRDLLIQAMHGVYGAQSSDKEYGRLGVTVSRLRRKAEKSGMVLPLKSLYSWGYMFTGET